MQEVLGLWNSQSPARSAGRGYALCVGDTAQSAVPSVVASGLRAEVGAAHTAPALEAAARPPPQSEMMKRRGVESKSIISMLQ
jgi:hypothetical protein